jgi:hypothetical protein
MFSTNHTSPRHLERMSIYTIALQRNDDPTAAAFVVHAGSFAEAKEEAFVLFLVSGAARGSVTIGHGEGSRIEWIGSFGFTPGSEPRWEAAVWPN